MSRRVAASSVNWAALSERVPLEQKATFIAFKARSDNYLRRVLANPPEAPKIDWAFYKRSVPVAGMVDNFQKQYEAFKVPFPADTATSEIEGQERDAKVDIAKFKEESSARIKDFEAEIAKIAAMIPYEDMTMEEFYEAHPEHAIDTYTRPTFWPHYGHYLRPDESEWEEEKEGGH